MEEFLFFNNDEEFNKTDKIFHPIFKNEEGAIKPPYQEGTLFYMQKIHHPSNNTIISFLNEVMKNFALQNPDAQELIDNQKISKEQAVELGFFPKTQSLY